MKSENQPEKIERNYLDINLFRFLNRVIGNLKWIVLCIFFSLLIAFLFNRYADRKYKAQALLDVTGGKASPFLSGSFYANFVYGGGGSKVSTLEAILTSRIHNEKVVDALDLLTTYYRIGRIKSTEVYKKEMPFVVEYDQDHYQWVWQTFNVEMIDDKTFKLYIEETKSAALYHLKTGAVSLRSGKFIEKHAERLLQEKAYKFDQWIETPLCKFKLVSKSSKPYIQHLKNKHYQFVLNTKDGVVSQMISQIRVGDGNKTESTLASLITVTMTGKNLNKIVDYINTSNEILAKNQLDQKNRSPENTIRFIESKLSTIRDSLSISSEELKDVRASDKIIDLSVQASNVLKSGVDLEMQKASMERKLEVLNLFQNHLRSGNYKSLISPSLAGIDDPALIDNIRMINGLYQERQKFSELYNPSAKPVQEINRRISLLRTQALSSIKEYVSSTRFQINSLSAQLSKIDGQTRTLPSKEQKYVEAQRLYIINNQQYNQMLIKLNEALLVKQSNVSDIDIIDPATNIGQLYVSPRPMFNYVIALLIGLFLPMGYMFAREVFDNKVRVIDDVVKHVKIPLIGIIGENKYDTNLVVLERPRSSIAESFRAIRSKLKFIYDKDRIQEGDPKLEDLSYNRTVLVTSSISGEGKTFVSINLASVFALSHRRTLLIGMDLRNPKIFGDFNIKNDVGLSNYLIGQATKEQIVKHTKIPHLDVLLSGPIPPNPSELLLSEALTKLIDDLKKEYKYIVLDTPPVGLVADTYELMKFSDANLYVIRNNYSYRDQFPLVDEKYRRGEFPNLTFVLNECAHPNHGYGYGYGYGYPEEDSPIKNNWASKIKRFLGLK